MDFELDEMRQQMAKLKNKLESQTIVNDRFIRRSIRNSVSTINRRYLVISFIALAMIPYGYWAFVKLNGLSIWLWLENISYEEIGQIVGISTTNVSSRLFRIKEQLKKLTVNNEQ